MLGTVPGAEAALCQGFRKLWAPSGLLDMSAGEGSESGSHCRESFEAVRLQEAAGSRRL